MNYLAVIAPDIFFQVKRRREKSEKGEKGKTEFLVSVITCQISTQNKFTQWIILKMPTDS